MEKLIDLKNKRILSEIEMNARIDYAQLSRKVGLSKQVVKYRIENLESREIIQGYNALIDISKLGWTIYVVYLKLIKISSKKEKKWIIEINKQANVLAVGKNAGHWDLTVALRCKNNQDLDVVLKKLIKDKSENIKEKLITSEIKSSYFSTDIIYKKDFKEFSTFDKLFIEKVDSEDEKIISILSNNCRTSLLDISKKVKLSPNGVKNRIKNLEKKKIIIGYKTKINYELLGFLHFRVFLHLTNFSENLYEKIKNFLMNKGNVESVSRYIGYADIDFRCYSRDVLELHKLISELKDNFLNNIIEVDSMLIFNWESINFYSSD